MSRINIIVAVTKNMVIGKGNDMPWHLPSDLKHFKKVTEGSCVIMGRKCWESIPEKFRPLPNRLNIVISRDETYDAKGAATLTDLDKVLNDFKNDDETDEVFVIGGAEIYKAAFNYADRVFITRIDANIDGDVILEGLNMFQWETINTSDVIEENGHKFTFETLARKKYNVIINGVESGIFTSITFSVNMILNELKNSGLRWNDFFKNNPCSIVEVEAGVTVWSTKSHLNEENLIDLLANG